MSVNSSVNHRSNTVVCGQSRHTKKNEVNNELYRFGPNGGLISFAARNSARRRETQHSSLAKTVLRRNASNLLFSSGDSSMQNHASLTTLSIDSESDLIRNKTLSLSRNKTLSLPSKSERDKASLAFSELSLPTEGWRRPPSPDPRKKKWGKMKIKQYSNRLEKLSNIENMKSTKTTHQEAIHKTNSDAIGDNSKNPTTQKNINSSISSRRVTTEGYRKHKKLQQIHTSKISSERDDAFEALFSESFSSETYKNNRKSSLSNHTQKPIQHVNISPRKLAKIDHPSLNINSNIDSICKRKVLKSSEFRQKRRSKLNPISSENTTDTLHSGKVNFNTKANMNQNRNVNGVAWTNNERNVTNRRNTENASNETSADASLALLLSTPIFRPSNRRSSISENISLQHDNSTQSTLLFDPPSPIRRPRRKILDQSPPSPIRTSSSLTGNSTDAKIITKDQHKLLKPLSSQNRRLIISSSIDSLANKPKRSGEYKLTSIPKLPKSVQHQTIKSTPQWLQQTTFQNLSGEEKNTVEVNLDAKMKIQKPIWFD